MLVPQMVQGLSHSILDAKLLEGFMLAANGVTARYLDRKELPSLRRVVRSPQRWPRIVQLAAGPCGRLPATPEARALEEFLVRRKQADPERFPDLSLRSSS
jgi:hypothetical protein